MHAGLWTQNGPEVTAEQVTWGRTVRQPLMTGSPPEPSWTGCTVAICAEQTEELRTSGPADTDGSPGSGWPGDATAAPQTDADEGRKGGWQGFSLKLAKDLIASCTLLICIKNGLTLRFDWIIGSHMGISYKTEWWESIRLCIIMIINEPFRKTQELQQTLTKMVELHSCRASIRLMTWRHTISTIWGKKQTVILSQTVAVSLYLQNRTRSKSWNLKMYRNEKTISFHYGS